MTVQTSRSKAPAANRHIASSSSLSAARVSKAAIDSVSVVLCRSLKSHNFFIITPCSARMRKAIRKSLACISLMRLYPSMNLSLVIKSTARATRQAFSMTPTLNLILTLLPNVDTFPLRADRMSSKAVKFVAGLASEQKAGRRSLKRQEATARSANRRLPVNFKALIRRLTIGGHARQQ